MNAAVVYENGGPEVLRYEQVPDPVCPEDGVLIDVEAISLEGGDLMHRAMAPLPARPHVVGYQCAGTITQVGAAVEGRAVGDRVVALSPAGSHADKRAVPAAMTWLIRSGLDTRTAACVPVAFGTAHECLFTAGALQADQTVLIHAGGGGVGMAAIQLAKRAGARVLATSSRDDKLARLQALGLDHGINYATHDFVDETRRLTESRGVHVVLDSVGGKTLADSVQALTYRGRLVSVGVAGRGGTSVDAYALWQRNCSLHGVYLAAALQVEHERTHAMIADCLERVAQGELAVEIDKTFPLSEAASAHAYAEGRNAFGRVVMTPR
ncbi:quinone oxidoreductase family protein [Haliangium sp.]|uniref:quinone oxidoreductase family protein n=1 Tax=Haliangium sp. TaxID=2663208 RepID=UPI003D1292CB